MWLSVIISEFICLLLTNRTGNKKISESIFNLLLFFDCDDVVSSLVRPVVVIRTAIVEQYMESGEKLVEYGAGHPDRMVQVSVRQGQGVVVPLVEDQPAAGFQR